MKISNIMMINSIVKSGAQTPRAELGSVAWGAWARAPRIMRGGHGAGTVVTAVVLLLSLQHPSHSTAAQVLHHTLLPSIRHLVSFQLH